MASFDLANIYEQQGHTEEALSIYKSLLVSDSENVDIINAIKRLSPNKRYKKISSKAEYFSKMRSRDQFKKFEKWLVSGWN
jgi:tetratricopeptide (TPR) repeat protein